jgi:hypothetical protein
MGTPCTADGLRAGACALRAHEVAQRDGDVVEEPPLRDYELAVA